MAHMRCFHDGSLLDTSSVIRRPWDTACFSNRHTIPQRNRTADSPLSRDGQACVVREAVRSTRIRRDSVTPRPLDSGLAPIEINAFHSAHPRPQIHAASSSGKPHCQAFTTRCILRAARPPEGADGVRSNQEPAVFCALHRGGCGHVGNRRMPPVHSSPHRSMTHPILRATRDSNAWWI